MDQRRPRFSRLVRVVSELVRVVVIPAAIVGVGVGGFFLLKGRKEAPAQVAEEVKPPLVSTASVAVHEGKLNIEVDGIVVPFRQITLSAEVEGTVLFKAEVCQAGRYVEQGTVLFRIDPRDYELEIQRLWKGFDADGSVQASEDVGEPDPSSLIGLAQQDLQLQQRDLERLRGLADVEGLVGGRVVSDAEIDQGRRSVMAAENTLMTLRSQLERANLDVSRTEIAAPIDGVVVSDSVEEGDFVRRGTALVTMEDTASVEVKCSLQMGELYWLWNQAASNGRAPANKPPQPDYEIPNAPARVIYRLADREYQWSGKLARYDGIGLDEATRTVPCRVVVASPRQRVVRVNGSDVAPDQGAGPPALVRGMYVTVRIEADPRAGLLDIPEEAVRPGNKVWVCRDETLAIAEVDVVQVAGQVAIIRPGELRVGEKVVVTPLAAVEPGMAIRERSEP